MRAIRAAAAGALLSLAGTSVNAGPETTITNPDWVSRPTPQSLANHYPGIASQLEIEGYAVLSCRVDVKGALNQCGLVAEAPLGIGFGRGALGMAGEFKMRPQTLNGLPTSGGTVRIPIRFKLPAQDRSESQVQAKAGGALNAGYRLADALRAADGAVAEWEGTARQLEFDDDGLAPADAREAAAKALRTAARAHKDAFRDAYAHAYASVLDEARLDGIVRFIESPAAKALRSDAVLGAMQQLVSEEGLRSVVARASATYCGAHPCLAPGDVERVWRTSPANLGRLDNPQWVSAPEEDDLQAARPPVAQILNLTGAVRLACRLDTEGDLNGCAVEEEAPAGSGFGAAALSLTDAYRLNPLQVQQGISRRAVTVRIGFPASEAVEPFLPPPPRSSRALELARILVVEQGERFKANVEEFEKQLGDTEATDPQLTKAARDALQAAAAGVQKEVLESAASVLAALISEEYLTALVDYRNSPAGKAQQEREAAFTAVAQTAVDQVSARLIADARAAFCKTRDCAAPSAQPTAASPDPSTRKP